MSAAPLEQRTYLPPSPEDDRLAKVHDFLAHHEERRGAPFPQYVLSGPEPHDRVELPAEVHRALVQVVEALRSGRAVTVAPHSLSLTTQQAADLLNVSRPTVVKLLEQGTIPHDRVGHRRKVLLRDVLDYRDRRRADQYAALEATSSEIDDQAPAADVLAELKSIRQEVAARRRAARAEGQG